MTETTPDTTTINGTETTQGAPPRSTQTKMRNSRAKWTLVGALIAVIAVAAIVTTTLFDTEDDATQIVDVSGQGGDGMLAADAARLIRRSDGLFVEVDVPLPEPGSYEYPTSDMVPPWAGPQPPVSPGAGDAPEVFTLWMAVFNDGSLCIDECDSDDLAEDAPARGGMYQLDGRIGDGDRLRFVGNIRFGQEPLHGVPLAEPHQAEIHVFIAPHGRGLSGADGGRQLNGPIGNPSLWWSAQFLGS